ncbi:L-lactate permease [Aliidiomarina sanyensis]|uniref:L-lactate permease n=1 Tax=Aliidiomarina sanyensis TaxID=1249555 RepID=A0A432WQ09_9GAMM|nr:L-lactate permease [Aliidiomarina sanyensis]RUO35882.1 L-lactate permease [Aliidiomarina sanyensis]
MMDLTPLLITLPFLAILIGMIGLRWTALKAGFVAVCITIPILIGVLGNNIAEFTSRMAPGAFLEAAFMSGSILWIIFGALCIYHAQEKQGATLVIRNALARLHPNPRVSALFIAWFFSLFMEGAAGFGTSAALTAPFLVSAGYRPVLAVVLALWGHSLGVVFGAVGTPVLTQAMLVSFTDLALSQAAIPSMILPTLTLGAILSIGCFAFARSSGNQAPHSRPPMGIIIFFGILAAVAFLVPAALIGLFLGPELPTLLGAVLGAIIFTVVVRYRQRGGFLNAPQASSIDPKGLLLALAPYLVLIALVLMTRLIPDVKHLVQHARIGFHWYHYQSSIQIFYHPGTLLFVSFLLGATIQRVPFNSLNFAVRQSLLKILSVLGALFVMLFLSRILLHGGAIDVLSREAIKLSGITWPFWVAWFGALGTFITGSATASNILFSEFQRTAALNGGYPIAPLLGAQSVGAAVGNMVCPHNIIAAGATVQLNGQEGEVMRYTLPVALLLCCLVGISALLWIHLL